MPTDPATTSPSRPTATPLPGWRILLKRPRHTPRPQPPREQVEAARRYADEALQPRSPLLGTTEAILTRFAIARAQAASGDYTGAVRHYEINEPVVTRHPDPAAVLSRPAARASSR